MNNDYRLFPIFGAKFEMLFSRYKKIQKNCDKVKKVAVAMILIKGSFATRTPIPKDNNNVNNGFPILILY